MRANEPPSPILPQPKAKPGSNPNPNPNPLTPTPTLIRTLGVHNRLHGGAVRAHDRGGKVRLRVFRVRLGTRTRVRARVRTRLRTPWVRVRVRVARQETLGVGLRVTLAPITTPSATPPPTCDTLATRDQPTRESPRPSVARTPHNGWVPDRHNPVLTRRMRCQFESVPGAFSRNARLFGSAT